ncbi:hypothetical protein [Corynebacterium dentalis]|uniref:hypothetical protein n=1 Tax=Corynebacterium dentalis TaxID=2014528 RepID=UPI00289C97F1|nr:hypothetical protein [Corynebacterium dentalis]
MSATSSARKLRRWSLKRFFATLRNKAMTYGQVYYPVLAGKIVHSLTSKSSSGKQDRAGHGSAELAVAEPEGRYNPPLNDRTNGIVAAQAAAAPLPREHRAS